MHDISNNGVCNSVESVLPNLGDTHTKEISPVSNKLKYLIYTLNYTLKYDNDGREMFTSAFKSCKTPHRGGHYRSRCTYIVQG